MAPRAPRPGTTSGGGKEESKNLIFKIVLGDDTMRLDMRDVGAVDEEMFEAQAKATLGDVFDNMSNPTYLARLVWLARRKRGERRLTFRDVLRSFPSRVELGEMFEAGTFDIDVLTGDEDEEETTDPLPSADT